MTARLLFLSVLCASVTSVAAAANPYAEYLDARALPGWREADGRHVAALELSLAPGWKTYWRDPGSAGVPPRFDWSGSGNLAGVEIVWPRPQVFELEGLRSIGYKDRVVLPLRVTAKDPSKPVDLQGEIQLGICETVCVPLDVHVAATLPAAPGRRDPAIAAALAARPYSARDAKLRRATCKISPGKDGLALETRLEMPSAGGDEVTVYETGLPDVVISDSSSRRQGGTLVSHADIISYGGAVTLDRSRLRITVLGSDHAVEITGCDAG